MASLLDDVEELAAQMEWNRENGQPKPVLQQELFLELTEPEKIIVDLIQQEDEIGIDQLSYKAGVTNSELASLLLNLEFKGLVRSLPGKRYILC
jgi:DNA processing protein